jgi:hypothetical protein
MERPGGSQFAVTIAIEWMWIGRHSKYPHENQRFLHTYLASFESWHRISRVVSKVLSYYFTYCNFMWKFSVIECRPTTSRRGVSWWHCHRSFHQVLRVLFWRSSWGRSRFSDTSNISGTGGNCKSRSPYDSKFHRKVHADKAYSIHQKHQTYSNYRQTHCQLRAMFYSGFSDFGTCHRDILPHTQVQSVDFISVQDDLKGCMPSLQGSELRWLHNSASGSSKFISLCFAPNIRFIGGNTFSSCSSVAYVHFGDQSSLRQLTISTLMQVIPLQLRFLQCQADRL